MNEKKAVDWDKVSLEDSVSIAYTLRDLLDMLKDLNRDEAVEVIIEYLCQNEAAFDEVKNWLETA